MRAGGRLQTSSKIVRAGQAMGDFAAPAAASNGGGICINNNLGGGLGGAALGVAGAPHGPPAAAPGNNAAGGGVPKHSTVVERLRQRIEGCRRHHVSCESRYQQAQAEQLELERRDTVSLYQRTLEQRAKKTGAKQQQQQQQGKQQQDAEPAAAEQRNHTLIMVRAGGGPGPPPEGREALPRARSVCVFGGGVRATCMEPANFLLCFLYIFFWRRGERGRGVRDLGLPAAGGGRQPAPQARAGCAEPLPKLCSGFKELGERRGGWGGGRGRGLSRTERSRE